MLIYKHIINSKSKKYVKKYFKKIYSYTINYEEIPEGGYQVTVPLLPGLITYGRNLEEAKKNG